MPPNALHGNGYRIVADFSPDGLSALWDLLDAWQDHMSARGLAQETRDQYEQYVLRGLRRARLTPETATPRALEAFLAQIPAKGSNRTAYITAFKAFFRFCVREGVIERSPADDLRTKPPKYPEPDYFEPAEAARIIQAASARAKRRGWAVVLLFETGARIGSLAAVEPRLAFRFAKGDRPYSVTLTPAASEAVEALLSLMRPEQVTLCGVKKERLGQWFHDAAIEAGFPPGRVHAHLARHTAATLFYRRTRDVMATRTFLNHADVSQVQRYVRSDDAVMREALAVSLLTSPELPISKLGDTTPGRR